MFKLHTRFSYSFSSFSSRKASASEDEYGQFEENFSWALFAAVLWFFRSFFSSSSKFNDIFSWKQKTKFSNRAKFRIMYPLSVEKATRFTSRFLQQLQALPFQRAFWGISCPVLVPSPFNDLSLYLSFSNVFKATSVTHTKRIYRNVLRKETNFVCNTSSVLRKSRHMKQKEKITHCC